MATPINAIASDEYAALLQESLSGSSGDTTPVFIYPPSYPLTHGIIREFIENDMGDGFGQTISPELPYTRADGMGGIDSHYGVNIFTIRFPKTLRGSGNLAYDLWDFIRTRLENDNEAFYFYNPSENLTPDPNGFDPIGRYLVRCANPNQVLNRVYYAYTLFDFGAIKLVEDRNLELYERVSLVAQVGDNMADHYTEALDTNIKAYNVSDSFMTAVREGVSSNLVQKPINETLLQEAYNWTNIESVAKQVTVPVSPSDDYEGVVSDDVSVNVATP